MSTDAGAEFDVAVVGASIAGCTAATMFARRGARVALIERQPDIAAYKRICTHLIHPSALPTLARTGLIEPMEAAGAVQSTFDVWRRWGWIRPREDDARARHVYAFNMRRELLDPMLRRLAAQTPGVELLLGHTVNGLLRTGDRVSGVEAAAKDGGCRRLSARLVVGADGRSSRVAKLAGINERSAINNRFAYFAYYRDLPLASGSGTQLWFLDPDVAGALPQDSGLTLLVYFGHRARLPEWKRDLEGSFVRAFAGLPLAPPLRDARRVSPLLGKLEAPNVRRSGAPAGLALVGDAALASDPTAGVGCSWALQSAEWLVEETAAAVLGDESLEQALRRYRRRHRAQLIGHHRLISIDAKAGPPSPIERLFFSAAVHDPATARHLHDFATRKIRPRQFLAPTAVARALGATRRPASAVSHERLNRRRSAVTTTNQKQTP